MIKVQLITRPTSYTTTTISSPNFQLYAGWNNSTVLDKFIAQISCHGFTFNILNWDPFEFKGLYLLAGTFRNRK
jgi:hypothetical protein